MSDFSPSDDELISSYLDGEATPDEVARVEADPALLARAQEFRAASELIATPVAVLAADDADRLIATALAQSVTTPTVTDLTIARQRRQRFQRRLVSVAAGVVVVGLAVPALIAISNSTNDDDSAAIFADADASDDSIADSGSGEETEAGVGAADTGDDSIADEAVQALEMDSADSADAADTAEFAAPTAAAGGTDEPADHFDTAESVSAYNKALEQLLAEGGEVFVDIDELIDSVTAEWTAFLERGSLPFPEEGALPDDGSTARLALEIPCGEELLSFLGWPDLTAAIGTVVVADEQTTIGVGFDIAAETAQLAIAHPPDCQPLHLADLG